MRIEKLQFCPLRSTTFPLKSVSCTVKELMVVFGDISNESQLVLCRSTTSANVGASMMAQRWQDWFPLGPTVRAEMPESVLMNS